MARTGDIEAREQGRLKTPAFFAWLIFAGIVVITGAVYIGKSDSGQIDVAEKIGDSNQAIRDGGGDQGGQVDVVPQVFQNMQNGGLVPQGEAGGAENGNQPAQPIVETTTGSSTAEGGIASSTDTESGTGEGATGDETQASEASTPEVTQ